MQTHLKKPKSWVLWGLLIPGTLIYSFCVILPLFISFRYSFFDWSGGIIMKFVGMRNYLDLLQDSDFWFSFKNNIFIVVWCIIGQIGIALLISVFLSSRFLKLKQIHQAIVFVPAVLSAVVVGFVWMMIYSNDYGLLNWLLRTLGLKSLIQPWLDDPRLVMYTVTLPLIWQYIGYYVVIFLAGLSGIPKEIDEVSELDGAEGAKKFFHITLPLIWDSVKVAMILCIAGNMKVFDHIFVMTFGGPGKSSTVMSLYAYKNTFTMLKLGYGSTIAIGIFVLSMALILISRKMMGGSRYE